MHCIPWLIFVCAVSVSFSLSAYDIDLLDELTAMYEKDQAVRAEILYSNLNLEEVIRKMEAIDREHLPRLKEIIHQFGWPGFQLVGEEGAAKMWLLVQHCDEDVAFQKTCLHLLKDAVANANAPKNHLAYLMDRVLVNEGNPQLYGTQFQIVDGKAILAPIEDLDDLDKRRAEMGLEPFADYAQTISKSLFPSTE
jgi:hypothetical protein